MNKPDDKIIKFMNALLNGAIYQTNKLVEKDNQVEEFVDVFILGIDKFHRIQNASLAMYSSDFNFEQGVPLSYSHFKNMVQFKRPSIYHEFNEMDLNQKINKYHFTFNEKLNKLVARDTLYDFSGIFTHHLLFDYKRAVDLIPLFLTMPNKEQQFKMGFVDNFIVDYEIKVFADSDVNLNQNERVDLVNMKFIFDNGTSEYYAFVIHDIKKYAVCNETKYTIIRNRSMQINKELYELDFLWSFVGNFLPQSRLDNPKTPKQDSQVNIIDCHGKQNGIIVFKDYENQMIEFFKNHRDLLDNILSFMYPKRYKKIIDNDFMFYLNYFISNSFSYLYDYFAIKQFVLNNPEITKMDWKLLPNLDYEENLNFGTNLNHNHAHGYYYLIAKHFS